MLKEFFEALTRQITLSQQPQLAPYNERSDAVYLEGGKMIFKPRSRGPKKTHVVDTASSLVAFILSAVTLKKVSNPVAFVGLDQVDFRFDMDDRQDRITFPMPLSDQYKTLKAINRKTLPHRDLIRLLRVELSNTMANQDAIIGKLRAVKWSAEENVASVVDKGKASLGKDMMRQFIAVDTLPDFLTFEIPVYQPGLGINSLTTIRCDLTPDEDTKQFILATYPGEFATAESNAVAAVINYLLEETGDHALVVAGSEST